ncbi:MAG TPA: hypothetical protein VKP30_11640 [Polyangiaceae bacterium]|nr:hypothetical protein [Polyangiaceae bacterium]
MRQAPAAPPRWLAIVAGASLLLVSGVAGVSTYQILAAAKATSEPLRPTPPAPTPLPPLPVLAPQRAPDWVKVLNESRCEAPCVGGSACATSGNKSCPSRYTCIPGEKEDVLDNEMRLELRLATFVARDGKPDPCASSLRRALICLTPNSTKSQTCVPVAEICGASARASTTVSAIAHDLVIGGVEIQIRQGKENGPIVASGNLQYGAPLRRVGLCTGFKAGGLVGPRSNEIKFVTFFIEPRVD